jgi:hypothetical protein
MMSRVMKSLTIMSVVVALCGISCTRLSSERKRLPCGESRDNEADHRSIVQPSEFSIAIAEPSTPNDASAETAGFQRVGGDPCEVRCVRLEIDINSGDLRETRSIQSGAHQQEVYESELSKEVRRLRIPISAERRWTIIFEPPSGQVHITYVYAHILPETRRLVALLNEVNATDEERRSVLERFLMYLRTERAPRARERSHMLVLEICDRHGIPCPFLSPYTEYLRQLQGKSSVRE